MAAADAAILVILAERRPLAADAVACLRRIAGAPVNLSKINRHTKSNDTVLVAGKVLASGDIEHSVTVAALNFSSQAMSKIQKAGGKCLAIEKLVQEHPKGSGIKILR